MFRIKARYRLSRRRLRRILDLVRKDFLEVLRFLLRGPVAIIGAGLVAPVGLAVMYGPSFAWGYLLVCVSAIWGIAAWILSDEVRKHRPAPLKSQKPKKIQEYNLALGSYRRWQFIVPVLILLFPFGFLVGHLWPKQAVQQPIQPTPPPSPIASSIPVMGCDWDHIPIQIPPASTIHVIKLFPSLLRGNPRFSSVGVFEDINSPSGKAMEWPSKTDGRWMTQSETRKMMEYIINSKPQEVTGFPNPWAFKCTMTNIGTATLEDTVTSLLVDTPDGKRHSYPVSFDPLSPNQPFKFYVVNVCSYGPTPTLVQWGDEVTIHVLNENKPREIPLRFERRNWPTQLITAFGPSSFLWNGMQTCKDW